MGDESKHADWSREVKLSRRALLKAGAAAPLGAVLASLAARHAAAEPRHWTYEGDTGPEQWGGLDPGYEACRLGSMQSPVDIPGDAPVVSEDIAYSYRDSTLAILDNGHTIQVDYDH